MLYYILSELLQQVDGDVKAEKPKSEAERLAALDSYDILNTSPEREFDDIVRLASTICQTPVALISFVEEGRQWFKSKLGVDISETGLDASICAHALLESDYMEVPDTTKDKRTIDNPLVAGDPHLRFYAGATLHTPDGLPLGTVCTLDYKPRHLSEEQKESLKILARQVMKLLELRRINKQESDARKLADLLAKENETLLREGDHRVMNSLQLVTAVLSLQARNAPNDAARELLDDARNRVGAIATVHRQLQTTGSLANVSVGPFLQRLCESMKEVAPRRITKIALQADEAEAPSAVASTLGLVVAELIGNSFKHAYSAEKPGAIYINYKNKKPGWTLDVTDEGAGLPETFDLDKSSGVGMKVVTSLVRRLHGEISANSREGKTTFLVMSKTNISES